MQGGLAKARARQHPGQMPVQLIAQVHSLALQAETRLLEARREAATIQCVDPQVASWLQYSRQLTDDRRRI